MTLVVARILSPDDYGLMALATILTGYVELFSELGLGAAIVQRKLVSQNEYSSVFWFSVLAGLGCGALAALLATPTAWLTNEPRVVPIVRFVGILFLFGSLQVVPFSQLNRDLRFKALGIIELGSVLGAGVSMLWMAAHGYGVWTLVLGNLVKRVLVVTMAFAATRWRPALHLRVAEAVSFLTFGLNVITARTTFYVLERADTFVVGRVLGAATLGYYTLARDLATLPTARIGSLFKQVAFPLFAKLQGQTLRIQEAYLKASSWLAILLSPLLVGGAVYGEQIILTVLGESWRPMVPLFRAICLAQLIMGYGACNDTVHVAQGRPRVLFGFYVVSLGVMPPAVYLASRHGLDALVLPWLLVQPALGVAWTVYTTRQVGLPIRRYVARIARPFAASWLMILAIEGFVSAAEVIGLPPLSAGPGLAGRIMGGGLFYAAYVWWFEREMVEQLLALRRG